MAAKQEIKTGDGQVGDKTKKVSVQSMILAEGQTVTFRNGADKNGGVIITFNSGTSREGGAFASAEKPNGSFDFPDGCYLDAKSKAVSVTVNFTESVKS